MGNGAQYLKSIVKGKVSPFGEQVADLLASWVGGGLYNLEYDGNCLSKADWSCDTHISINVGSYGQRLATYDFDYLTNLVVLSHDRCIRAEIRPHTFNTLKLVFHPRKRSDGELGISKRMPTLESHIEILRAQTISDPDGAGISKFQKLIKGGRCMKFEITKLEDGTFIWKLIASNGNLMATSHKAFARKKNAVDSVQSIIDNAKSGKYKLVVN